MFFACGVIFVCVLASQIPPTFAGSEDRVVDLTASTSDGEIIGHLAKNRSSVLEFLGIPYAQPPTGNLRFAAPAKRQGSGSYVASDWSSDCPQASSPPYDFPGFTPRAQQIINYFAGNAGTRRDEDCLTLNIWTRPLASSCESAQKPVLVFFYGGRTAIGTTHSPVYDGQYFADAEDVVVVTVNYRLNIFGFPGCPGCTQNLGFRDQRLAVEWLRDNVAAFGGDASRITIFGQSSGGVAVDYWSYAYLEDPIVAGLISHSGNAFSFPLNPANLTISNWYNVSAEVGCGSTGDTVPCMRTKKWEEIEEAASNLPSAVGSSPLRSVPPFYPSPDGEVVLSNYRELSLGGHFAKIPHLLGNNNNEQGYYIIPAVANGANPTEAEGDLFLLQSFTCPNYVNPSQHQKMSEATNRYAHGVLVWQYRYFGHWENLRLYPGSGAYHGSDIEMVFGNSGAASGIPPSEPEEQVSRLMQHAWAAFAATSGLSKLGCPEYDPERDSLVRLAYKNRPEADFVRPSMYDHPCSTIELGARAT
ncbi:hypothetical protein LTR37_017877 [Vermiconidia calcicola]|uniref:Uncharacterized protein n=1 Tax=Vermiconidia calcicola TaxID=1690605 RepID=A0ACC3MIN6_9PEZI|nr:hypothetical protein LTR37_017877 [Vermiconidia calcicola]